MNIALIGNGKMGRMIESLCEKDDALHVAGFVGPNDHASLDEIEDVDVAVDFSYPGNLDDLLACALARRMPLVIGTTGLSARTGRSHPQGKQRDPDRLGEQLFHGRDGALSVGENGGADAGGRIRY